MSDRPTFTIVGGGPCGSLLATHLGQAGYRVDVYEMRDDPKTSEMPAGRSINLALSHRGICGLEGVGLADQVLSKAVAMPGRMIHAQSGALTFQPYGKRGQAINSVSRGDLNALLLDAAGQCDGVTLHFNKKCTHVDPERPTAKFVDTKTGEQTTANGSVIVGADGAFSAVRRGMQRTERYDVSQSHLAHGYKELTIPAGPGGTFQMERNALHIWPRRSFMMIALPNEDGSYTCTLFWPFDGPSSFAAVDTPDALRLMFNENFPDAVPHMPDLVDQYFANPVGSLMTVRTSPWYHKDKVVLLGDACHAVVPFYGQGMNAGFEDLLVLMECIDRHKPSLQRAFADYHERRKVHVDTLADMAIANFVEMRDHTGSPAFIRKKKKEKLLHWFFPNWYIPLYSLATFTRMPYKDAVERAKRQDETVRKIVWAIVGTIVVALFVGIMMIVR